MLCEIGSQLKIGSELLLFSNIWGLPDRSAPSRGDAGSTPESGRLTGGGNGKLFHILTCKTPQTAESGGLHSVELWRVRRSWAIKPKYNYVQRFNHNRK